MFKKLLIIIPLALSLGVMQAQAFDKPIPGVTPSQEKSSLGQLISSRSMSLSDRYPVPSVNSVFRDNILLTLAYLSGSVRKPDQIYWGNVRKPASFTLTLQSGEVFAFHDDVLPEFAGKKIITTNAHFGEEQGFLSDGYLYGDGVCHFASLINWAATNAGLKVVAPVRHDFARIPGIAPEYGTAIYYSAGEHAVNEQQNLYVENTFSYPVKMVFVYKDDTMTVSIYK